MFRMRNGETGRRRALIIVENLPVPLDRRVWQEALALAGAGWRVAVICPRTEDFPEAEEERDGILILRHPLAPARRAAGYLVEYAQALYWQIRLSLRVRRRMGIDVIQGCSPPDLIFLVARLHRLLWGTPYIFDHHDLSPELFEVKFGPRGLLYRLLVWVERRSFRASAVSIATNETFRTIAVERGGMDPSRVVVVKSYPDPRRFERVAPAPGLAVPGRRLVGYVGIMGAQDGVDMLIRAMAGIVHGEGERAGRQDVGCVIIGDGPELRPLTALAAELGLGAAVVFTGYLSGPALLATLSTLDLGVIPDPPNAFNDKLSMNKVFEYMMLGLPFVMFDLAQARSEAGEAAETVAQHSAPALAAAILGLLDDAERARAMGEWGRAEAGRRFRWPEEAARLLAAYDLALEGSRSVAR
jgi:glycosyltransferase involved in cell wall biosynthesis